MKKIYSIFFVAFLFLLSAQLHSQNTQDELCVGYYQTERQAVRQLEYFRSTYNDLREWKKRARKIRKGIIYGTELKSIPKKFRNNKFKAIIRGKKEFDGYSIENIAIEVIPGYLVTGNLYKPERITINHPAVLCPHGHWNAANDYGRFREDMQKRCASLACMGAVVFAYDMHGYGESIHSDHNHPKALKIQTWNSMRVVDYLLTLPYIDKNRIAITGASGGASQTFILAAIDKRIAVSVPVVQISAHFFGGCVCESGMPVHMNKFVETSNVEIAALVAPRPMLIISDGDDWTKNTPEVEFPYILGVYKLFNAHNLVENEHFADEKHDYNFSKRKAAYKFLALHLALDINKIRNRQSEIDESFITILPYKELKVFDKINRRPDYIVIGDEEVDNLFNGKLKMKKLSPQTHLVP